MATAGSHEEYQFGNRKENDSGGGNAKEIPKMPPKTTCRKIIVDHIDPTLHIA